MKRYKHNLSHYKLLTSDMAELTPISCFEVLPGDSVQQSSALLLRVSPLIAPVMHPVSIRVHHWYVPYRLLWTGWEEFITGGSDGEGGSSGAFPQFTTGSAFAAGDLGDYFGVPPGLDPDNVPVSKLPFRAYNKIFNENYRDQDLVTEVSEDSIVVQKVAWEKDRFTTARPWPQKGPDVTLPLGVDAPVLTSSSDTVTGAHSAMKMRISGGATISADRMVGIESTGSSMYHGSAAGETPVSGVYPSNLYADLASATAVNINDVRRAFALQRYEEARAQYGSRFTEYLRYLGIRSLDARLQRPEYLGGGKQTIAFTEVLQTGPDASDDQGVGRFKGHGIAAMRTRPYRKFFEEHGIVISLMSVRPRTMYGNGLAKFWSRTTKEDFWQKELELIGQEEVYNKEVYYADTAPNDVFGYNDRYSDYRHIQSNIAGDFRTTLNFWHMARIFAGDVALNSDFVTADPTKRIHAVQTADVLWTMASHNIVARRLVCQSGKMSRVI